jgi:serine/threonine-protein kinase RsbW
LRQSALADGRLRLILNNSPQALEDGRLAITRHLAPRGFDARALNRLEVIFEELVSNIIRHGFSVNSDQSICVTVAEEPGAILLTFEDDGTPFDPLEIAEPRAFTTLETAKIGGLGIALVRKLSAQLSYERLACDEQSGFSPRNRTVVRIAA